MNILIIGSKGFIGNHAYHYFKNKGHHVFGADVAVDYADSNYVLINSTNSDYANIFATHPFDVCINCSGAASVPASITNSLNDFTLNTFNVFKILEAVKNNAPSCKVINLSSAAIYGNPESLPIKETDAIKPLSPYGFHKKMAEELLFEFHTLFNIQCCSLRIFSAYGVGLQKQLLWDVSKKALASNNLTFFGTGNETRDFIYISDILHSMAVIIENGAFNAAVYNIANGIQIKIKDVVQQLLEHLNFKGNWNFSGENRAGDPLYWVADITKIKNLGYTQQVPLEQGINLYASWIKELKF